MSHAEVQRPNPKILGWETCPACNGQRYVNPHRSWTVCPTCNGEGKVTIPIPLVQPEPSLALEDTHA